MTNTAAPRRRGRPPKTAESGSERILSAALELFSAHGFEGVSVRQITAQAGVDPAMVSHGFGSKRELWRAVIDDIADKVLAAAQDFPESLSGPGLDVALDRLIDIVCDTPFLAQFVVIEAIQRTERAEYVYERLSLPIQRHFGRIVEAAKREGRIGNVDPDFLVVTFLGSIAIAAAARHLIQRSFPLARDPGAFKRELKRAVRTQISI